MKLTKCPNGHFYDADKHPECPYCNGGLEAGSAIAQPGTAAEVAAAAGVSRSTASRALNDSPRISEETKRRVRAAAKMCIRDRPSALSARHLENSTTAKPASSAYFAISHYTLLYLAILCYILLYLEQRWLTCKQTLLSPQQVKHLPRLSAAKMCSKNSMRASSTGLVPRGA